MGMRGLLEMKVAILQSNYLPWTGVFELINSVDKFVFYDNVQFTKHSNQHIKKQKKTPFPRFPSPCNAGYGKRASSVLEVVGRSE